MPHTPDLSSIRLIGFDADDTLWRNSVYFVEAERKLAAKGLDMVVANDVSSPDSGFAVDTNRVTFVFPNGRRTYLPLLTKAEVAARVVAAVEQAVLRASK